MLKADRARLFHPKLIQGKLQTYPEPLDFAERQAVVTKWIELLHQGTLATKKETQLDKAFLADIFGRVLGYRTIETASHGEYSCEAQRATIIGRADGALGRFFTDPGQGEDEIVMAPIELKGAAQDLDKPQSLASLSPVKQLFGYLAELSEKAVFGLLSNLKEIRLYSKQYGISNYELFELEQLAQPAELMRFIFLCGPDRLLWHAGEPPRAVELLRLTDFEERKFTTKFYAEYKLRRETLFNDLLDANPGMDKELLLEKVQKVLDRVLFILFAEDRGLVPAELLRTQMNKSMPGLTTWGKLRALFEAVDKGWTNGEDFPSVPAYNGKLFAFDADLETMVAKTPSLPSLDFRAWAQHDFATEVNVRVLGHIFEQSISDIEDKKALFKGVSLRGSSSKRKKEGVYYTPQYITRSIVQWCIGKWLAERRAEARAAHPTDELAMLRAYQQSLSSIKVLDPACGSGAFLVAALDYLLRENAETAALILQLDPHAELASADTEIERQVLANNIHGVDLNPESVEITKLSLWLQSAHREYKLLDLDSNIRVGDSLVDDPTVTPRAFEWDKRFHKIMERGGFDVIIGNPPYVKLQVFRRLEAKSAEFLRARYQSCRHGNFDLYLPFIERGLELLHPQGYMGYIAPSLWLKNDYGRGLKEIVREKRCLRHWIDFGWHQVFEDALNYVAIQYFAGSPADSFTHCRANLIREEDGRASGFTSAEMWSQQFLALPAPQEVWPLLSTEEQLIVAQLSAAGRSLQDCCGGIHVGLQTSANDIYHLTRQAPNLFVNQDGKGFEIEDEIMRPLLGGDELERYARPQTTVFVLFPYREREGEWELIPFKDLPTKARKYLKSFEERLRSREHGKFDGEGWFQLYPKNIDKQHLPKLCVAETIRSLEVTFDQPGACAIDNVRVNGILPHPDGDYDLWYLLGLLNSKACNWDFRFIAAPKASGYFEANKQYIAPLPIPNATKSQQKAVIKLAQELTEKYTKLQEIHGKFLHDFARDLLPRGAKASRAVEGWHTAEFDFKLLRDEAAKQHPKKSNWHMLQDERDEWEARLAHDREEHGAMMAQIAKLERQMDDLVYSLYGLSAEQIALIESGHPLDYTGS